MLDPHRAAYAAWAAQPRAAALTDLEPTLLAGLAVLARTTRCIDRWDVVDAARLDEVLDLVPDRATAAQVRNSVLLFADFLQTQRRWSGEQHDLTACLLWLGQDGDCTCTSHT